MTRRRHGLGAVVLCCLLWTAWSCDGEADPLSEGFLKSKYGSWWKAARDRSLAMDAASLAGKDDAKHVLTAPTAEQSAALRQRARWLTVERKILPVRVLGGWDARGLDVKLEDMHAADPVPVLIDGLHGKPDAYQINFAYDNPAAYAATTLGRIGDRRAVEPLMRRIGQALQFLSADTTGEEAARRVEKEVKVLAEATKALERLADRRATKTLLDVLRFGDSRKGGLQRVWARDAAIRALGRLPAEPAAVDALLPLLDDKDASVRMTAARALAETPDPRAAKAVVDALTRTQKPLRERALLVLARLDDPRARKVLIEKTVCCPSHTSVLAQDIELRIARRAFALIKDPKATAELIQLVSARGRGAARAAVILGDRKSAGAVTALIGALGEKDGHLVTAAAGALAEIGEKRAVPALIDALRKRRGKEECEAIVDALGRLGDAAAVEPLLKVLEQHSPYWAVQPSVAALGRLKARDAVKPIMEYLYKEVGDGGLASDQAVTAAEALGRIGEPVALVPMASVFRRPSGIRSATRLAEALSCFGRDATPYLLAALDVTDYGLDEYVAQAIERTGDRRAVPALAASLKKSGSCDVVDALLSLRDRRGLPAALKVIARVSDITEWMHGLRLWELGPAAVPALCDALKHLDEHRYGSVIPEALGILGDRRAVQPLTAALDRTRGHPGVLRALGMLQDPAALDAVVREAARTFPQALTLWALRRIDAAGAVRRLGELLNADDAAADDPDDDEDDEDDEEDMDILDGPETTATWAAQSLGAIGLDDAVGPLAEALAARRLLDREPIVMALARYRTPQAEAALKSVLEGDDQSGGRWQAIVGLRRIGGKTVLDWADRMLRTGRSLTRRDVCQVLAGLPAGAGVELLIRAAGDTDSDVRRRALDGLEAINSPRAVEAVIEMLQFPNASTRTSAGYALRSMTGQDEEKTYAQWTAWWAQNKGKYRSHRGTP